MPWSYDDLRVATLARQFALAPPTGPADLLDAIGPIQSQSARSAFLGLAARGQGLTHAGVSAAYDQLAIVRGSSIRGTVHTMTPRQQQLLDGVTRFGQRPLWERTLRLQTLTLEQVWTALEDYAQTGWRTSDELCDRLIMVLDRAGETAAATTLASGTGRYFSFGHGGLIRRPTHGGWDAQTPAEYRTASALTGLPRVPSAQALSEGVRQHLRAHGPVTRYDIAWWSGLGLRTVDATLAALAKDLIEVEGPEGRTYYDIADAPAPRELDKVGLLPPFDALLCAYDPRTRTRFVAPEHHEVLWLKANGQMAPPLLVDGRITGFWRIVKAGQSAPRTVEVHWFSRTRRPRKAELEEPLTRVAQALGISIGPVTVHCA